MSGLRSLTAAQVISQVDYLDVDFDPAALTVSQLLGILAYHNVRYPTPYTKPKLVQLFLDEIKPKATKLRKERLKRENSIASDDGITDGVTGQPINGKGASARRSSRRPSHSADEHDVVQRLEQPKRRRSSAQPSLGRAPKGKERAPQPTVMEESEPEEMPARKMSKSNKADAMTARHVSTEHPDDSGWEDNNIFQSGPESSSPARPSPANKGRRKSAVSRKSRHSMSAPPQLSPPSSPPKAPAFQRAVCSPPQSKFEPLLPPGILRQPHSPTQGGLVDHIPLERESMPADQRPHDSLDALISQSQGALGAEFSAADDESACLAAQATVISHRIPEGSSMDRLQPSAPRAQSGSYLLTVLYAICLVVGLTVVINFKMESQAIGYCDTGSNSNRALEEFQARLSATQASNWENRTFSNVLSSLTDAITFKDGTPYSPFSHIPLPHPSACTPCPEYATCTGHKVTCNPGHILRPHPFLALLSPFGAAPPPPVEAVWNFLSKVANGLPGLGPIAFPSHCIEDPKRKRNIGALGKAIEALLGQERGRRICAGGPQSQATISDTEGGDARKWGVEIETLRETMKQKTAPHLLETFDDTFNEAIQQLTQWGSVVFGEDMLGKRYLAHKMPNMTLNCQLTVKFREQWFRWRTTFFACLAGYCAIYVLRRSRAQRQIETKRVAELVQITLDTLRNQELAHHTDPLTAPQAYLSSIQLRDLILQDEHSISARRRLWDQVERIVESNANVRANLEEVQGGDELRVWRWVGNAGMGPEYRKRVQTKAERGDQPVS
ncbi:Man1-Src1p-C-terminal domain-containing protein [Scleroderma yunnanense]